MTGRPDTDQQLFELSESVEFWKQVVSDKSQYDEHFHDRDGVLIQLADLDKYLHEAINELETEYAMVFARLASKLDHGDETFDVINERRADLQSMRDAINSDHKYRDRAYWEEQEAKADAVRLQNQIETERPPLGPLALRAMVHGAPYRPRRAKPKPKQQRDWHRRDHAKLPGVPHRYPGETTAEFNARVDDTYEQARMKRLLFENYRPSQRNRDEHTRRRSEKPDRDGQE